MGHLPTKTQMERAAQRRAEMNAGRLRTTKTMMEGVIEQLCNDYDIWVKWSIDASDPDCRKWEVVLLLGNSGITHRENLFAFPSDETKAMIMLLER